MNDNVDDNKKKMLLENAGDNASYSNINFSASGVYVIKNTTISGSTFINCRFDGLYLMNVTFSKCTFSKCTFSNTKLLGCVFTECSLYECYFDNPDEIKFYDCVIDTNTCNARNYTKDYVKSDLAYAW